MKAKQKQKLVQVVFGIIIVFLLYLAVFFNLKIDAETANFLVKQNEFAVGFVNNITDNAVFYGLIILVGLIAYSVTKKKRK